MLRSIFDIDNIDIGPERRAYLETKLERVWEINSEGSIPWCALDTAQHSMLGGTLAGTQHDTTV